MAKLFDFPSYSLQEVPEAMVFIPNNDPDGPAFDYIPLTQHLQGKRVVLIGIPGAFTPTCTEKHLPGFVKYENVFYNAGIDEICCVSYNDPWVMNAFSDYINHENSRIVMIADPKMSLTDLDLNSYKGTELGVRLNRFAMVIDNNTIHKLFVDEKGLTNATSENCLAFVKSEYKI